MAARKQNPNAKFKAAVEKQAGACRSLAMALQADADARSGFLDRHDKRLIDRWADILAGIADALTAASANADRNAAGRWSKAAAHLALPLAVIGGFGAGVAEGAGQGLYIDTFGDNQNITECANEVINNDGTITAVLATKIRSADPRDKPAEPTTPPRVRARGKAESTNSPPNSA